MCAFFSNLIIWELHFKVQTSFETQNFMLLLSLSPSLHLLLLSSSYPWLPMLVSFFLTLLHLEVASLIIFFPSPFHCHLSSRSKVLHWWRRSKAYKLNMELHHCHWGTSFIPCLAILALSITDQTPSSLNLGAKAPPLIEVKGGNAQSLER